MINNEKRKIYTEVDAILEIIGEEERNKVPKKMRDMFKSLKLEDYNPKYTIEKPLNKQNISRKALQIIAVLHFKYLCNSGEEKEKLKKIFDENEKKHKEKYNSNNIFA